MTKQYVSVVGTDIYPNKPIGTCFYIDQCEFKHGERIDISKLNIDDDKIMSWPMVYILANDDYAYVGQTSSIATRMDQHGASVEKKDFTTVNIIFNEEFNSSVVTDYEHRIIGLMHADGKYQLTNKNEGMTDTNYFSKQEYSEMFEDLWNELRTLELADKSIEEIEELEVFKYSPYKKLTPDQKIALNKILQAIDNGLDEAKPIIVEGVPGTGKTILAIYLLKALKDNSKYKNMNIKLLEPVPALRSTMKKTVKNIENIYAKDIIGPYDIKKPKLGYLNNDEKSFDIILVDETHRLQQRVNQSHYKNYDDTNKKLGLPKNATQLDWITSQTKLPIFFYDPLQTIGPKYISPEMIKEKLGDQVDKVIKLGSQMRVKGGEKYLDYVSQILSGGEPNFIEFSDYEFYLHENFSSFNKSFETKLDNYKLTRMTSGYAWPWKTKKDNDPAAYDISIEGYKKRWNDNYENWVGRGVNDSKIANEVGSIYAIQGYDLSYAYVIIGNDLKYDNESETIFVDEDSYFDRNGKATASLDNLDTFIKNIYYVLLTRGIYGTHVYVCNKELYNHLSKFIKNFK